MTMWLDRSKVMHLNWTGSFERMRVVGEEHQRRQTGRTDGIALGHRLGRVADRIQRIGDVTHRLRQTRHFGDTAGVVGDRTVSVERDDDAGHRQHRGCGNRDAVQAGQRIGDIDRGTDDITGSAQAFIETPRPAMMLVRDRWSRLRRRACTGVKSVPV
jgi:hypothetical protein